MIVGETVCLEGNVFYNDLRELVPIGSTLRFLFGFCVRQEVSGMCGYGYVPSNFWTVALVERGGVVGVLLPEGEVEDRYKVAGVEEEKVGTIRFEPTFIPLGLLRFVSNAEVVALPPA